MKASLIIQKEKLLQRLTRKKSESNFQLPIQLAPSDNILICLPESNQDNLSRLDLCNVYQKFFPAHHITFCAPSIFQSELSSVKFLLFYDLAEKYTGKKVSALLQSQLKMNSFQIAIDLNYEFSLLPALICKAVDAPIRISFEKDNAQLFFNITIKDMGGRRNLSQSMELFKEQITTLVKSK